MSYFIRQFGRPSGPVGALAEVAHATGIDHSTLMVGRARRRLAASISAGRAEVLEADASRLPLEAGSFDRVFAVNSFAFWRDCPGAIEGVLRVLKPRGRLVIVHQPRGNNATDDACRRFVSATTDRLERSGFVNVHAQFLPLSPIVAGIIAEPPARPTGPDTWEAVVNRPLGA